MNLIWQAQTQSWTQPVSYCVGTCTCGNNCRVNLDLHTAITGALQSDDYSEEVPCVLPELDDALYEMALASLSGGAR